MPFGGNSYDIGMVNKKVSESITIQNLKPIIVSSYIRNKDDDDDAPDNDLTRLFNAAVYNFSNVDGNNFPFFYLPKCNSTDSSNIFDVIGGYTHEGNNITVKYKLRNARKETQKDFPPVTMPAKKLDKIVAEMILQIGIFMKYEYKHR